MRVLYSRRDSTTNGPYYKFSPPTDTYSKQNTPETVKFFPIVPTVKDNVNIYVGLLRLVTPWGFFNYFQRFFNRLVEQF